MRGQKTNIAHNLEVWPVAFESMPPCWKSGDVPEPNGVPTNFQNQIKTTHLSTREYEHESRPSCRHPPGEEGPQQGLEHSAVALEHAGYGCVQRNKRRSAMAVPSGDAHMF